MRTANKARICDPLIAVFPANLWVEPYEFVSDSGKPFSIARCAPRFKKVGHDLKRNKPFVECDGSKVYPELAILSLLQKAEWDGRWVDDWPLPATFWRSQTEQCPLPNAARLIYDRIIQVKNGKAGGCWDVLAWRSDQFLCIESKQPKEPLKKNQKDWLEAATRLPQIVDESRFIICEWIKD